jgi:hypothetical protein
MKDLTSSEDFGDHDDSKKMITLSILIQLWNCLDTLEFSPLFQGSSKRRLYLRDMSSLRSGGKVYFSLGGNDRKAFNDSFLRLNRRMQHLFIQCCQTCLHENRFINQSDVAKIIQDEQGKRFLLNDDDLYQMKRQKTAIYDGIYCFN